MVVKIDLIKQSKVTKNTWVAIGAPDKDSL